MVPPQSNSLGIYQSGINIKRKQWDKSLDHIQFPPNPQHLLNHELQPTEAARLVMCSGKPMIFLLPDQTFMTKMRHLKIRSDTQQLFPGMTCNLPGSTYIYPPHPPAQWPNPPWSTNDPDIMALWEIHDFHYIHLYSMIMSIHQYPPIKLYRHPNISIYIQYAPYHAPNDCLQSTSISRAFGAKFAQNIGQQQHLLEVGPLVTWHGDMVTRRWPIIGPTISISPGWHRCTGRRCPGWRELLCSGCHLCHRPGWDTWPLLNVMPNVATHVATHVATINQPSPSSKPSWLVPPWNLDLVLWLPPTSRILWATGINEASWHVKLSASSRSDQAGTTRKELTCLP